MLISVFYFNSCFLISANSNRSYSNIKNGIRKHIMYHKTINCHSQAEIIQLIFHNNSPPPVQHYLFCPIYMDLSSKQSLADDCKTLLFGNFISTDLIILSLPWNTLVTLPRGQCECGKWSSFIKTKLFSWKFQ